ncbi:hypothetical protein JVT61DRAFT_8429 [Boletus reticuloceps]|uniref:G domain-containing protein n=1 Tax=Boletus reticuloceps TaxID=495285 RepID=A0A8I2YX84_9AGAM|nr:hypothetical protein JVT61DRAFT_8429 [Boletus reticuloceps]
MTSWYEPGRKSESGNHALATSESQVLIDKRLALVPSLPPPPGDPCRYTARLLFRMSTETAENNFENLQEKFGQFRILIIGPANSGKTTILRGICDSTENPEIYDGDGNKARIWVDVWRCCQKLNRGIHGGEPKVFHVIQYADTDGDALDRYQRGLHNVEDELIFRSNDKLIFHDSRGFEAGSKDEFLQMKKFVADRAKTTVLKKRIAFQWTSITEQSNVLRKCFLTNVILGMVNPMPLLSSRTYASDLPVPVIVLFTKFDALLPAALGKLDRRLPLQERLSKAEPLIEEIFGKADIWGRLSRLKYPPRSCVRIGGMHKSNEGCSKVLATTADALNEEALQMLLISAQKVNMELCVRFAVQSLIYCTNQVHKSLLPITNMDKVELQKLALWFPHVQVRDISTPDCV